LSSAARRHCAGSRGADRGRLKGRSMSHDIAECGLRIAD
jgi:hypothetical protein